MYDVLPVRYSAATFSGVWRESPDDNPFRAGASHLVPCEVCCVCLRLRDDGLGAQPQRMFRDRFSGRNLEALPAIQVVVAAAW